jgi:hypothetical protein
MAKLGRFVRIPAAEWLFQDHGDVARAREQAERYQAQYGSLEGVETRVEEYVRQWILRQLIDTYGYPEDWVESGRLKIEHRIAIGSRFCQADIALLHPDGRPFLLVETKAYNIADRDYRYARGQLESYLSATHSAALGVLTDGRRTSVLRKQMSRGDFALERDLPAYRYALLTLLTTRGPLRAQEQQVRVSIADQREDAFVDEPFDEQITERFPPSVRDYVAALRQVEPRMSDVQRAFLVAHYRSPDRTATATELAYAVGALAFQTTNMQYGKLAGLVMAALGIPPRSLGANVLRPKNWVLRNFRAATLMCDGAHVAEADRNQLVHTSGASRV